METQTAASRPRESRVNKGLASGGPGPLLWNTKGIKWFLFQISGSIVLPRFFRMNSGTPEQFDERLIESSPDCIKVLDLDGRLLSMNAGGRRALEICDLGPVLNSSWIDFWQGEDRENARKAVAAARAGSIGRFVGFFATTQTKTPKWWDVVVSPIFDASSRPEKLLASSRDVTEWKRAQD